MRGDNPVNSNPAAGAAERGGGGAAKLNNAEVQVLPTGSTFPRKCLSGSAMKVPTGDITDGVVASGQLRRLP